MLHRTQLTNDLTWIPQRSVREIARELVEQVALAPGTRHGGSAERRVHPIVQHPPNLCEVEKRHVHEAAEITRERRVFLHAVLEQIVIELLARHQKEHGVLLQKEVLQPLDQ